jgi:hypothetical protein
MNELELPKLQADLLLRENGGDLKSALEAWLSI